EMRSTKRATVVNEGFRGIGLHGGQEYHFSAWARTEPSKTSKLVVRLVDENGKLVAEAPLEVAGSDWQDVSVTLRPSKTVARARLELALNAPGRVDLDMVSLCPADTWKGRPHGWRKDLVQQLADLRPAFFRFPGGCIVEGSTLQNR